MLKIKLLKVHHAGEEARKLKPHIQECDVWGIESSCFSREVAERYERAFVKNYSLSRTAFKRKSVEGMTATDRLFGLTDYFQRMSDYLFQTKTPLYLLERFEPNEKGTLDSLNALSKAAYSRAREAISRLDFDNFFPPAREEMRITIETADIRDQHIASNLERAEGYIRRTYPSLASKETISLNAFMGSSHMPELYTKMTIGVVDLTQNTSGLLRALLKNYRLTGELPDRDLLAYQIDNFITVGAIPHIFSYEELETLELEQLKTRIIEWGNTLPDAPEPSTVSA